MSSLRKKALIRLLLCAVFLIASIVFSFLLLNGTFDGGSEPASDSSSVSDSVDSSASDAASDENGASAEGDGTTEGTDSTSESVAEPTPEPTPEATPASFDGLSEQPTTVYAEGEQPNYTVTPDSNMNLRAGPGTDFDKVAQIPAGTAVTALGTNADETWVVVQYEGQYGWLAKEYLNAA